MEGFSLSKFPRFDFTTSLKLTPQRKVFLYFSEISWQSFLHGKPFQKLQVRVNPLRHNTEAYSEPSETSKMESFAIIFSD